MCKYFEKRIPISQFNLNYSLKIKTEATDNSKWFFNCKPFLFIIITSHAGVIANKIFWMRSHKKGTHHKFTRKFIIYTFQVFEKTVRKDRISQQVSSCYAKYFLKFLQREKVFSTKSSYLYAKFFPMGFLTYLKFKFSTNVRFS